MDFNKDKVLRMADSRIITHSGQTMCGIYRTPLEQCETAEQAIRLYKNAISFALLEKLPTKTEMLSFADKEVWARNGVYIDTEFDGERIDSHVCCVFIGCKGHIRTGLNLKKQIIPKLYLSEGSSLIVDADANLIYPIDVELYYGSHIHGDRLSVKSYNDKTAKDNVGFTDEELNTKPNMEMTDL